MATLQHKMDSMKAGHDFMLTTVIGIPYAPSVASFKDLHKGMIRDLRLETNHRGSYLLLRFKCSAMRMNAVLNIVEDEAGTVVEFTLYMQEPEVVRAAETILKNGAVIILKEPYFKVATSGSYLIRVDHPTDIVWLSEDDPELPCYGEPRQLSLQNVLIIGRRRVMIWSARGSSMRQLRCR